ncbi:MAG: ABC transporter substrate-binding protein [Stackebrandtia sp.]
MSQRFASRVVAAASAGLLVVSLAACSSAKDDPDVVNIGWLGPLTGNAQLEGEDMLAGVELYLDVHDNMLGGREVNLTALDEGETADDAMPNAQKLVKQDEVVALTGILNSPTFMAVAQMSQESGIPLLASGGRPSVDPAELNDLKGVWHTSLVNEYPGQALAPYVYDEQEGGSVYAIGPDHAGGYGMVGGFAEAYAKEGGELANEGGKEPTWTPYPDTADWTPWLNEIAESDAKAVFFFYPGANAVDFVTQYAESEVKDVPLYTSVSTETPQLVAQKEAALGIKSSVPYSADLDNAANREFVSEWANANDNPPWILPAAAWDAMLVLDTAIGAIPQGEEVTSEKITAEIEKIGEVNSPRGPWRFGEKTHAPVQRHYLREVRQDGDVISNVVLETLDTLGE